VVSAPGACAPAPSRLPLLVTDRAAYMWMLADRKDRVRTELIAAGVVPVLSSGAMPAKVPGCRHRCGASENVRGAARRVHSVDAAA